MKDSKMEAAIIFDTHLPDALRRALEYAGNDGFVASMPQLLHARVAAPFDNDIWDTWFFTSNSEESMVETPQGNHIAVLVHGGGIFASPTRFRKLYLASTDRHSKDGFTGLFGGKILRKGMTDLPRRYAVVMDFETARTSQCGFTSFDELKDDPLMIVRAGGAEAAAAYLDKAQEYYGTSVMGSWHRFDDMDPMLPQTWVPFVYDCLGGASDRESLDPRMRVEGNADIWFTHYRISRDAGFGLRADTALIKDQNGSGNLFRFIPPRGVATGSGLRRG
jgi:hypothetical protein